MLFEILMVRALGGIIQNNLNNNENGLTASQRNDRMNRKSKILVWSTIDLLRIDFEIIE